MAQTTHAKKTKLACDSCRRQRRKCDRRAPVCSLCERRNEACVYDPIVDQRRSDRRDYFAALEARVALLEGILKDAGARDVGDPSGPAPTNERDSPPAMHAIVLPPTVSTQPEPRTPEFEQGFVPSDDAAQAVAPITHPSPGGIAATTPEELDLGMGGYVPLVSLDMEHKLLAQFWYWQRLHMPFVAPVPFLSAYALYAQVAHPGEPIPPPPPPPPPDPLAGPSAISVPSVESVHVTPELAQFISPLLLDAMFVIGALFHGNAEMSDQFYKRAESRVIAEAANPRLATVQGVTLVAAAELGHARASATWTLDGVAVALCVRLGMHIDATPLVRCGTMSKMLYETRNFVFWTTYNNDRFYSLCLGMHPLMDRRIISTPRHSSLATANVVKPAYPESDATLAGPSSTPAEKPVVSNVGTTWWSPATLGMGDVVAQAGWEAIRDLARIADTVFDGIYSFDAPKRSPQEDLELVARNNLTIQRFLDDLPTWLRSTDVIQIKLNGIVYFHLFIHLVSILACRPFLSPRSLSEDSMRSDATTDISQPTHSSRIIRRYRTLAFRIARASALQITSLIRHIPLSSPCMSTPYFVYTACTILLLVPGDTTAMNNVRAGVTCLESMYETGYWMNCMKDGRDRILALARRWGVDIEQGCMVLGSVAGGLGGGGCGPSGPSTGERDNAESDGARPSDTGGDAQTSLGSSSGTRSILGPGGGIGGGATQPSTSTAMYDEEAKSGTARSRGHSDWTQQDTDNPLARAYTGQEYTGGIAPVPNDAASVPQENDNTLTLDVRYTTTNRGYGAWERNRNSHSHASGLMYAGPADGLANTPQEQVCIPTRPVQFETQIYGARNEYSSHTYSGIVGPELPVRHREGLVPAPQQQTYHQQTQYQHHHHKHTPSASIPHLNYTLSHAEPQHDSGLPHTHWHQTLPPADLNLPPPPDPAACSDLAMYFAGTIRTAQKPVFVKSMEEPRAGRAADGISDTECNFSAVTLDVYTGRGGMSSGTGMDAVVDMSTSGGVQGIYAQGNEARRNHRPGHLAYGYDGARYTGGYGGQGM